MEIVIEDRIRRLEEGVREYGAERSGEGVGKVGVERAMLQKQRKP
jgi:hypothetical protein